MKQVTTGVCLTVILYKWLFQRFQRGFRYLREDNKLVKIKTRGNTIMYPVDIV
jgi:uncharacterized membrane protein